MIIVSSGIFIYVNGFLHFVGRPIWKINRGIVNKIENTGYIVRTKASVYEENKNLLTENADLKAQMINYKILENENISLKESLGLIVPEKDMIISNILTKPNYSPYDTLIIDTGSNSGISLGDKVYSNVISPIGEVSVLYDNSSLVTLYSNPGLVTEAMMDSSNASVELIGRGGGNFEMIIPVDLQFVNGGFIYLPGFQSEVIAIIKEVISSPNDPVKRLLLSSPVNVQNLKWVFVKRN